MAVPGAYLLGNPPLSEVALLVVVDGSDLVGAGVPGVGVVDVKL